MRISLDGGALCAKTNTAFGNYTFTKNFVLALSKFSPFHSYLIYTFCNYSLDKNSNSNLKFTNLGSPRLWMKLRIPYEELKLKNNIFLALNQAVPSFTSSRIITFSHGLSFLHHPIFYGNDARAMKKQLVDAVKKSEAIVVSSDKVRSELLTSYPFVKKCLTLTFGVPFDMQEYKKLARKKFFLYVGMDHPIKNLPFLLKVFEKFRMKFKNNEYKLVLVSNAKRSSDYPKEVEIISSITRENLRKLYQTATAYLSASHYESFNFPVLEALSQNCPVITRPSSVIPEMKEWVYIADSEYDFVLKMGEASAGRLKGKSRKKVTDIFSWKSYIEKLHDLYKETV